MHRPSFLLALTGAGLASAQGFSSECTDISLTDNWLVATCPTGSGSSITSSVFLNNKIVNNNGNLEWVENGRFLGSCVDCAVSSGVLSCTCRGNFNPNVAASLNLEEHISNYAGHLLSNQTGPITTIPPDSSVPVPSSFDLSLSLVAPFLGTDCSRAGAILGLNNPQPCYYINPGGVGTVQYSAGIQSGNQGWEIVAYEDPECTSEPVYTFTAGDEGVCVAFQPYAAAFGVRPLWNADY
ncbi:uncharacterized protein DSM5745_10631 [Aspergillus mulundensis]|uniref:Cyanovirin-N domain-containing protein n=1 Tax=Aspergillus mulundensis TaxID=1810919 RepID=A0A3D8QH18_9EURO|nr:Uncharacterized protein DSM5745_10631 [Aspergillus mulundensis]RDW61133.1 Uncharacterized protein DSM5745_10631 [Aspergillus mulundensis]